MNVLVVNAGSSTLKYQVIDTKSHKVSAKGSCERVCFTGGTFTHAANGSKKVTENIEFPDHKVAIEVVLKDLEANGVKIEGIGHRIVQGGWYFGDSSLVDEDVLAKIREVAPLAPLHNNPEANVIEYCLEQYPDLPNVTVYDTAFHFNMPEVAKTYALPKDVCDKLHIRKYGAHGTSHRYIAERAAAFMDEPLEDLKLITCHLGNGCSISAIDHGVAVDTSMGLTPLDGLMMGTRCGAIDPAIVPFIMEKENLTAAEVNDLMNKKSGLLGISGISNDLRSVRQASEEGDERAQLAYDMYSNSAKKYIGQYIAVMGGVDAIVLTAGVGENCDKMRRMIFAGLQPLGIKIDLEKNRAGLRGEREISTDDSEVRIVIIPTDEEYMIARDTYQLVKEGTLEITELV